MRLKQGNIIPNLALLIFSFILFGCSAGRSVSEYQPYLTNETVKGNNSSIEARVPVGWYQASDNQHNLIDIWLIKEDNSAVLNLIRLNIDDASVKEAGGSQLEASLKYSKTFKKASADYTFELAGENEYTSIGSFSAGIYKYKTKSGATARVLLFVYEGTVYEITAAPAPKANLQNFNYEELFRAQNALLSSVE